MSPVGHSLVGATIAVSMWQEDYSASDRGKILGVMIIAANIPDLPFPYWGHTRYDISHSVFSGMAVIAIYSLLARLTPLRRTFAGSWRFQAAGTLAIFSHYFLDTLYNHGKGLAGFWPFSEVRVAIPIPWLAHMQIDPLLSAQNSKVWAIELLTFGSLSALFLLGSHLLVRIHRLQEDSRVNEDS